MARYYIEAGHLCGLVDATDKRDAERFAKAEFGRMLGEVVVRLASGDDNSWAQGMGAQVHQTEGFFRRELSKGL